MKLYTQFLYLYFLNVYKAAVTQNVNTYTWGNNDNTTRIIDMTERCQNGFSQDLFLPFGVGVADAVVLFLAPREHIGLNCRFVFNIDYKDKVESEMLLILVVEFFDVKYQMDKPINVRCRQFVLMNLDTNRRVPYCEKVHSQQQGKQVFFFAGNATSYGLRIAARLNFDTLKITITAGRDLGSKQDCRSTEVKCLIDDSRICISNILLCDGNINCGKYDENDEHYKVCQVAQYEHLWIIVLAGVVIIIIIVSVGLFLIKTMIKKMTDNFFIFDEDEDNKLMLQSMMRSHVIEQLMKVDETCICDDTIIKNQTETLKK